MLANLYHRMQPLGFRQHGESVDGSTTITGSFSFTKATRERNAENLLVIHDADLAGKHAKSWWEHLGPRVGGLLSYKAAD